jgi:threonine/homoserine/homoserine lactone efflux protein
MNGDAVLALSGFVIAVLLLLLTPGPTNTLLAIAGASGGLRRSLPLVAAELTGYLTTIVPLVTFAGPWLAGQPAVALAVKLVAAVWVLLLAVRLWNHAPQMAGRSLVTFRRVYTTTALNPKGLIVGLALIPPAVSSVLEPLPYLVLFAASTTTVAVLWIAFGATLLRHAATARPVVFGRVAASFLLVFAVSLAGRAIGLI